MRHEALMLSVRIELYIEMHAIEEREPKKRSGMHAIMQAAVGGEGADGG